jgi:hypothetical protein
LLFLRIDHVELTPRRFQRGARPVGGRGPFLVIGIGQLEALRRGEPIGGELAVAHDVELGARHLSIRCRHLGADLCDHRLLQIAGGIEIGERRLLGGDRPLRLGERRPVVAVVKLDQEVAGMHGLVVGDRHLGDEAGDLGRDDSDVAADIGIVGAFDEAPDRPPIVTVPGDAKPDEERQAEQPQPLAPQTRDREKRAVEWRCAPRRARSGFPHGDAAIHGDLQAPVRGLCVRRRRSAGACARRRRVRRPIGKAVR